MGRCHCADMEYVGTFIVQKRSGAQVWSRYYCTRCDSYSSFRVS